MIETITSIITAVATLGMVVVAWYALQIWRKEFIGKKKIELAIEIMRGVYDIQDLLIAARINRFSNIEEKEIMDWMQSEKLRNPQNTDIYPTKLHYLAPTYRLNKEQEKIEKLIGLFNKACLYWDEDILKLIQELHLYILNVRLASKELYYNPTPVNQQDLLRTIYYSSKDDEISKRVADIVEEFKLNMEPLYKDQRVKWKKLKAGSRNE